MPSEKKILMGTCGKPLKTSVWSRGHSIRCEGHRVEVRYWLPEPTIEAEVEDFCKGCKELEK